MATSFCPRCGTPKTPGNRFCGSCGLELEAATGQPVESQPGSGQSFSERYRGTEFEQPAAPVTPAPAAPGASSRGRLLGIGVLVLALALGGVFLYLQSRGRPAPAGSGVGPTATPTAQTVSSACATVLGPFIDTLEDLDSRLSVGMNFAAYSEKVGDARVAYDRIDFSSLDATCIDGVGVRAENAFNEYVKAYTAWNNCVSDVDCDNDSVTPTLQGHWSRATEFLNDIAARMP
jgi:hypothetical protein